MSSPVTTDDPLASAAVEDIRPGMIVGLGTGRAATRAIEALARRVTEERMSLDCVATSQASAALGSQLGLRVVPLESIGRVDHLFDGADEVDPSLRMIKGRGGAMTRERLVAHAARRRLYLVQARKLVARLGQTSPLPVEVVADRLTAVERALRDLGLDRIVRRRESRDAGSAAYLTDGGNPVLDARLADHLDLDLLAAALDALPGVVGHGLFLDEADVVLIEDDRGQLSRRTRVEA